MTHFHDWLGRAEKIPAYFYITGVLFVLSVFMPNLQPSEPPAVAASVAQTATYQIVSPGTYRMSWRDGKTHPDARVYLSGSSAQTRQRAVSVGYIPSSGARLAQIHPNELADFAMTVSTSATVYVVYSHPYQRPDLVFERIRG